MKHIQVESYPSTVRLTYRISTARRLLTTFATLEPLPLPRSAANALLINLSLTNNIYLPTGLHPWFVHAISLVDAVTPPSKEEHYASLFPSSQEPSQPDPLLHPLLPSLPEPTLLSTFLSDLEANLSRTPSALVGEVGLDQAFRIPFSSPIDGKKNSELATPLAHQLAVLQAQLGVAVKLQRHVSFHSVRSPMDTVKLLDGMKKVEGWERIHVCLHSFGGSPETAKQIQRCAHEELVAIKRHC